MQVNLDTSFGNQGAAQAQNLRDSGIPNDKILIANRDDHYAEDARSKGFTVKHDFGNAAEVADGAMVLFVLCCGYVPYRNNLVIFLLIPDQVQQGLFNGQVAPKLKKDATIVIASGYNVYYKFLNIAPTNDVVMVAPR